MLEKTLAAVVGVIALATATVVAIVAAAFALYLILTPVTGEAGAAAVVAGAFALIVAIVALIVAFGGGRHHRDDEEDETHNHLGMIARLIEMGKERPLLSIGAAIAAGVIAIRNPALVATIVAAFLDRPKPRA